MSKQNNFYQNDFKTTNQDGKTFKPVLQDYSNLNFNDQIKKQMSKSFKAGDLGSMSSDGKETDDLNIQKNLVSSKQKVKSKIKGYKWHLLGVILLDLWLILSQIGLYMALNKIYFTGPADYQILFLFMIGFALIFKLCFIGSESQISRLIHNKLTDKGANEYIDSIRQTRPQPRQGIECQHKTTSGSKGKRKTTKHVTQTGIKEFSYKFWADWSPEIYKAIKKSKLTAIVITKKLIFQDKKTESIQSKFHDKLVENNKNRDTSQRLLKNLQIENFKHQTLACNNLKDLPFQLNALFYWLSMPLITSIYYQLFWSKVATIKQKLIKVISLNEIDASNYQTAYDDDEDQSCEDNECKSLGTGLSADDEQIDQAEHLKQD